MLQPASLSGAQLDAILALGWYRMHQDIFTTSHVQLGDVYPVHWLRYAIADLLPHTSHRRIRKRAGNFSYVVEDFVLRDEHKALHQRYRASIDFDGAPSITDCLFAADEVLPSIFFTKTLSVYDGDTLIAAGYFDVGDNSTASILHFYDPAYQSYTLGKYLILLTIDFMRQHQLTLYYPGYVVAGNPKMDYKLFLGKQQAQYFDPRSASWLPFHDSILQAPANGSPNIQREAF